MTVRRPDGQVIPPPPKAPAPASEPAPDPKAGPARAEPPTTNLRGPTPDEILADPLVRTVLDVFEGEVKRIHPRPKKPE
jgi:hypothetical protein